MDPRERLRIALQGAGCARCGRPYGEQGIQVLAQREEIAFVQLVCSACRVQTLALVTGVPPWPEDDEDLMAPESREIRGSREGEASITAADVAQMHDFLATYEGDLRDLLDNGRRGRGR